MEIVEENKRKILEVKEKKNKFSIDLDEYSKHGKSVRMAQFKSLSRTTHKKITHV